MGSLVQNTLAVEAMKGEFSLFNELTKLLGALRNTPMSDKDVKNSGVSELVFKETNIKIDFFIDPCEGINAYMMPPQIDKNHPFYTTRGFRLPYDPKQRKLVFNKEKVVEAWVDDSRYQVGGAWSNLPVKLAIFKGMMNFKGFEDEHLAAIFLHELGHVYTYFSLFGMLTTRNTLTDEAIKSLTSSEPLEKRVMSLELLAKDLDIDIKNKEKIAQADDKVRADLIESIVITEEIAGTSGTSKSKYETRNVEQIADKFAVHHGAGAALAESLTIMFKSFGLTETKNDTTFVILEIVKVVSFIFVAAHFPILAILGLLISIPFWKVYDDPQARVELTRKHLMEQLKNTKKQPELHKAILGQIEAIDQLGVVLKDRRSLYDVIYQTITPRGRTMYRQEVFMKSIENLLFNETYLNAAKFGELK